MSFRIVKRTVGSLLPLAVIPLKRHPVSCGYNFSLLISHFTIILILIIFKSCSYYDYYYRYETELEKNRVLWDSKEIENYNYQLFTCQGESPVHGYYNLYIRENTLHYAEYDTSINNWQIPSDTVPKYMYKYLPTINSLFYTIEGAIEHRADEINVEYDSIYGYPKDVQIDYMKQAVDDEVVFEVYGFTIPKIDD